MSELGEYESLLLGKILRPVSPVVCIQGGMGAGKSTTINYLIHHVIGRMDSTSQNDPVHSNHTRLLAHIDFHNFGRASHFNHEVEERQSTEMLTVLCDELRARSWMVIDEQEEYFQFWNQLVNYYFSWADKEVNRVTRVLITKAPWIRNKIDNPSPDDLVKRQELLMKLQEQDMTWYLRYLILLWCYLIRTRYNNDRGKATVILDNVDTLSPHLQRLLISLVLRNASQNGPTFVILMRPETLRRQGLADTLVDVVHHEGPTPIDMVADRLKRFCKQPDNYFKPELGLTKNQAQLIEEFLQRIEQKINDDHEDVFSCFMRHSTGSSVRMALILAQGLLLNSLHDMKNSNLTPYFLIRACVRHGNPQFQAYPKNPIDNPFNINRIKEGRFLLKPRILNFIRDRGDDRCNLSVIRSTFALFGYPEESIKSALNEMLRNECQLLRSDGFDVYRETWGDEQETLYLTAIGKGYIDHLIYSTDFVQEVMLDCYINQPSSWPKAVSIDLLTEKFDLLYLFLRELHKTDADEVASFIDRHGVYKYHKLFGGRLISLDIVQQMYLSVNRIIYSVVDKYPHHKHNYMDLLSRFTSLLRMAEQKSNDLTGVAPDTINEMKPH